MLFFIKMKTHQSQKEVSRMRSDNDAGQIFRIIISSKVLPLQYTFQLLFLQYSQDIDSEFFRRF